MAAKMGRPTLSLKEFRLQIRADKETVEMLDYCEKKKNMNRSDVVRDAIKLLFASIVEPKK